MRCHSINVTSTSIEAGLRHIPRNPTLALGAQCQGQVSTDCVISARPFVVHQLCCSHGQPTNKAWRVSHVPFSKLQASEKRALQQVVFLHVDYRAQILNCQGLRSECCTAAGYTRTSGLLSHTHHTSHITKTFTLGLNSITLRL